MVFVLGADRSLEPLLLIVRPLATLELDAVAADLGQYRSSLFAPHYANSRIWPHPHEARAVRSAAHAVIPGTETTAYDKCKFRHLGGRNSGYHLSAVFRDALVLILAADHEAIDILQKQKGYVSLSTELNEMSPLLRRFAEEDAVVGNNSQTHPVEVRKASHQRASVTGLEFVEP
ncbi:hypothetical protein D9M70_484760 [compost metagenome]